MPHFGTINHLSYGAVIENSALKNTASEIYKNSFSDLNIGIQLQEDNRGNNSILQHPAGSGLHIQCNVFEQISSIDMGMIANEVIIPQPVGGAHTTFINNPDLRDQGFCNPLFSNQLANNIFDDCNENPFDYQFFHHGDQNSKNVYFDYFSYPNLLPDCYTDPMLTGQCEVSTQFDSSSCPTKIPNPSPISGLAMLEEYNIAVAIQHNDYFHQIDGGSTKDLLETLEGEDFGHIHSELLGLGSWISDFVLLAFLEIVENFTEEQCMDFFASCSPLSPQVYQAVMDNDYISTFDESFFSSLIDFQSHGSAKFEALHEIDNSLLYRNLQYNIALRNDLINDYDSVINYMLNDSLYVDSLSLVSNAIRFNKISEATNILSSLSFLDKHQYVAAALDLRLDHIAENISFPFDEPFVDYVFDLFENNLFKGEEFKSWLSLANYLFYDLGPYYFDLEQALPPTEERPSNFNSKPNHINTFKIYPNPSNGQFDIILPKELQSAELFIYSPSGQLLHKEVLVNRNKTFNMNTGLPNGIYLIQLIGDNKALYHQKISILK